MKPCLSCRTINAPTSLFCKQCGKPLADPAAPGSPPDATVRWSGQQLSIQKVPGGVPVAGLFATKDRLVVGRAGDCDVCLPHPMVSRYHAMVQKTPEGLQLRDLGSVNGVLVGGRRITDPVPIRDGERVGIGPFLFTLKDGVIHAIDSSRSLRLEARGLEKVVPVEGGKTKKLLDNINLVVNPGEFVSLLGPSGSGKSTLMDCLNGRRRATGGKVLANGEDFYRHFDNFRQSLGYVPQKDIVHTQLTVYRALYYTAKLRLPIDTGAAELSARIEAVVREMELDPHRHTLVANLSGGQIKRVSLGAELLAQPCMLYIDEATSGLDAGTEARMMRLFRRLSDEGRSIICITHNVDNVEQCHLILILARGKLIFYGPPAEALAYFQVGKVTDIYDRLGTKDLDEWEKQFAASTLYQEFIERRLAAPPADTALFSPVPVRLATPSPVPPTAEPTPSKPTSLPVPSGETATGASGAGLADRFRALTSQALRFREFLVPVKNTWHQFRVLTSRYLDLILGDQRSLRLLLLQAPIVGVFLLLGFLDKNFESTVPRARELNEGEREMLLALELADDLVNREGARKPEEEAALNKVGVEVPLGERGEKIRLTGAQFVKVLQAIQQLPLREEDRKFLEKARLTFADGTPLTVGKVAETFRKIHQSGLITKLRTFQGPVVPEENMINPRYTYMLLFILVMIVMWFGCNNAAKEIVKEEAIYGRERAVNLGIFPYLASKFLVLSVITICHALLLMLVLFGTLQVLHWYDPTRHSVPVTGEYMLSYLPQAGVLALLAMTGVALGLLLSACVATADRANTLLPYVLIPQMILGGGFLAVENGVLYFLAITLSPVYWAYQAVHLGASTLPPYFPGYIKDPINVWLPYQALVIQTAVLLLLTAWFLRRKDA